MRLSYKAVASNIRKEVSEQHGYTGQAKELNGMYNYRARIYDPKLRQFLSPDPLQQQWSAFSYVGAIPFHA